MFIQCVSKEKEKRESNTFPFNNGVSPCHHPDGEISVSYSAVRHNNE